METGDFALEMENNRRKEERYRYCIKPSKAKITVIVNCSLYLLSKFASQT